MTLTAGYLKIFSPAPRLGFLAHAAESASQIQGGSLDPAIGARLIFNDRLNATVAAGFMIVVVLVVVSSVREWLLVLRGRKPALTRETPFIQSAWST